MTVDSLKAWLERMERTAPREPVFPPGQLPARIAVALYREDGLATPISGDLRLVSQKGTP